jgi:hypothetical protein
LDIHKKRDSQAHVRKNDGEGDHVNGNQVCKGDNEGYNVFHEGKNGSGIMDLNYKA